jgi:hypothetical protein
MIKPILVALMVPMLSMAEIENPLKVDHRFYDAVDTSYLYEYDSYTIENYKTVVVSKLDYTHKFYATKNSIVYMKYNDTDTVTVEQHITGKTLVECLKIFEGIDIDDYNIKFVYSDWKFVGIDVNGTLYSIVKFNEQTGLTYSNKLNLSVMPKINTYKIFSVNGRVIYEGENFTGTFPKLAAGAYILNVKGLNFDGSKSFIIK